MDDVTTLAAQQLRVVQKLLWDTICEHLKPAEKDEVGSLLNEPLTMHTVVPMNCLMFDTSMFLKLITG